MMERTVDFSLEAELLDIVEAGRQKISNIRPSTWTEQRRVLTSDISAFPGPFSYNRTPYLKEIINHLSPSSPAKQIAVMKGAQIGFSTGVIESGIGWIISENPGPILFLSGHIELSEKAMNKKIDQMIDSCGLRHLIRPNVIRKKNARTGDTSKSKEFPGGDLTAGAASNHSLLRQISVQFGFIDDFENAPRETKESGSTERMVLQRFASYMDKMKIYWISTPELKSTSNIEPVFLKGDQRRYNVPCPCCKQLIPLMWTVDMEGTDGREKGGITWRLDEQGRLIDGKISGDRSSVGYICQKCGGFFDDSRKFEMNLAGEWIPTAEPSEVGYYSYHISSLYAPPGMFDWEYYVRQYLEANPVNGPQKEHLQKAFVNLGLGETFEQKGDAPKANDLQKNCRDYEIGTVPDKLSVEDGNGHIILITMAADLNGTEDDARVDYELVAWSESGSSYSIKHGSIGTFIPRENSMKEKVDRKKMTYQHGKPNSVWTELTEVINGTYLTDTGKRVRVQIAGIDCGHYSKFAYAYIDKLNSPVRVGLKGRNETKYMKFGVDVPNFRPAAERARLYLVEVNAVKDDIADLISLRWDGEAGEVQPPGFMNFPFPGEKQYTFGGYFQHFEAEHRITETKEGEGIGARWVKKNSAVQNHFWDVRVYNYTLRDIFIDIVLKTVGSKKPSWKEFADLATGRNKV